MSLNMKLSSQLDSSEQDTYDVMGTNFNTSQEKNFKDSSSLNFQNLPVETSKRQERKERRAEKSKTLGKGWFNIAAGELNEETKNDLQLIKMRGGFHKDRFYKSNDSDALPKYFQKGTIVDDPIDFYSDRVPKKQLKRTIFEELVQDAKVKKFAKKNYSAIQSKEEHRRKKLSKIFNKKKNSKPSKPKK